MKVRRAPLHLKPDGRRLWKSILAEYEVDDAHGLALLQSACEALDRQKQAAAEVERHGLLIVNDKTGAVRANPACVIERDSRTAVLHYLKAMHFDIDVVPSGFAGRGRPPGR